MKTTANPGPVPLLAFAPLFSLIITICFIFCFTTNSTNLIPPCISRPRSSRPQRLNHQPPNLIRIPMPIPLLAVSRLTGEETVLGMRVHVVGKDEAARRRAHAVRLVAQAPARPYADEAGRVEQVVEDGREIDRVSCICMCLHSPVALPATMSWPQSPSKAPNYRRQASTVPADALSVLRYWPPLDESPSEFPMSDEAPSSTVHLESLGAIAAFRAMAGPLETGERPKSALLTVNKHKCDSMQCTVDQRELTKHVHMQPQHQGTCFTKKGSLCSSETLRDTEKHWVGYDDAQAMSITTDINAGQSALCPLLDLSIVAGVTSIVNPAKNAEILPFSISAQNFANLATKSANDPKDKGSVFGTPSATSDGPIKKDSSLASIHQGDLSIVYGLETLTVTSGTTTQTVAEVALISRVYQHFNLFAEAT
ncbi:uncharacterized protein THITE_117039 [Thermothielavioides terrestris NRRL 8126]|uniref:Uncharacterized protein n=1 Tax=Thermothielavioides terrestris (strain ATCC 38088 / NRRL 8126) TaxID=578455 RepID=G2RG40_THETT|nr:uncharacterized protein THITE_117039 [Thermothielavioides terrestris NRRL 8126]AEO71794.1 hypothetical protein THITE_117039 [Thermothielavioides terrestris NRRL 8126]